MAGMMTETRLFPFFLLLFSIVVAGCTGSGGVVYVRTGEAFTLGIGQSARVSGEDLVITFEEVTGDSRCPREVMCVWAGEAKIRIRMIQQGTPATLVLSQPGLTETAQETAGDYTLTFNLEPYPVAGETISPDRYRLTMTVTR